MTPPTGLWARSLQQARAWLEAVWWNPSPGGRALLMWPLACLYGLMRRVYLWPWQIGWRPITRPGVPVVVVGNIVVGGAGKTPTVIALVEGLRRHGWTPGVVSRGYGARHGRSDHAGSVTSDSSPESLGDEPVLIHRRTGAPVWVDRDRPAAVRALLRHHPQVDVVVSDDGRQHPALHRDAELLVFDERGVGNGLLIPAGPLREPLPHGLGPQTRVLYNAAHPTTSLPGVVATRRLGAIQQWLDWRQATGVHLDGPALRACRWRAVAGIGHPERFFSMLESAGLQIVRCPLPDHAPLWPRPWPDDGLPVLMTEKDAVKVLPDATDLPSLHVATLDFELPASCIEPLHQRLTSIREAASQRPSPIPE